MATAPGYSIPLPDGEYRVTLHFVELWDTRRRFDCRIEGQVWLSDYCPGDRGLGVAEARTTTVSVVDGALDLEFPVRVGWAAVAAIEIRPEPSARPERGIDQE